MPPRVTQGQGSFSLSQESQQVVCPLKNQDGTNCRKRCLGEKRFRSMQEHIRRAHPDHYIPKLPATEESFQAMINLVPSARPPPQQQQQVSNSIPSQHYINTSSSPDSKRNLAGLNAYHQDRHSAYSSPAPLRTLDDPYPTAANAATAAVALAQLHGTRQESGWTSDNENDGDKRQKPANSSYDLPPIRDHLPDGSFSPFNNARSRELLPSILARSPPGRSTTLPPVPKSRPRKSSLTHARMPKHERTKSKEYARRMSMGKASSAEPMSQYRRWEELIDAATSANGADSDRDLTPIPQSPRSTKRSSLPPVGYGLSVHSQTQPMDIYKASPLQRALTPPAGDDLNTEPFPSVEGLSSSLDSHHSLGGSTQQSGTNFHMRSTGLSTSTSDATSPLFNQPVQIYCANCRNLSILKESFACDNCISGFCGNCVFVLSGSEMNRKPCPRCRADGVRYKGFQLDLRI